jgi:hypothetical protein
MTELLKIASKVEAAVQAYISVQGIADRQEWKERFRGELVGAHIHGVLIILHFK